MTNLQPAGVACDAWRTEAGGTAAVAAHQQARLAYARTHSQFYADLYRGSPKGMRNIAELPPVSKPQLMARFDDWVTHPDVHRSDLERWISDLNNLGGDYLGALPGLHHIG